jgi:hypothetical protein
LRDYESAGELLRCWDGQLHLPAGLAEAVAGVSGLAERAIEQFDQWLGSWLGGISGSGEIGPEGAGTGQGTGSHGGDEPVKVFDLIVPPSGPHGPVDPSAFSLVQVFDVGWLSDPGYQRQLDNFAASPGAFKTIRVMKVFTSGGTLETGINGTAESGTVWPAGAAGTAIDFSVTLNALAELTSRGLTPFIVLSFFPDGIYNNTSYAGTSPLPGPTGPSSADGIIASDWTQILANWTTLVEAFFAALIGDPRFGGEAIGGWWFEVWDEPDDYVGSLWGPDNGTGGLTYYQQLYQATCTAVAAAVTAKGYTIRLGGPTITGPNVVGANSPIPGTMPTMMSDFIDFVKSNGLQCNFLSFHAKGSWSSCLNGAPFDLSTGVPTPVVNGAPVLQSVVDAADQTAAFAKAKGLTPITVINDEADMRLLFDVPFRPRMTQQFPTWLTALMIAYDSLASEYAPSGIQFMLGSDDAELPLVGWTQTTSVESVRGEGLEYNVSDDPAFAPAAFGQQRSIMTAASTGGPGNSVSWQQGSCSIDLLKVPVYNFYELLRLLGDQHGTFLSGSGNYYPHNSDLFHIITVSSTHIGSIFCVYPPDPPGGPSKSPWPINYTIVGIPWSKINWYQFQIDGTLSNGFSAAGGPADEPVVSVCAPNSGQPFPVTSIPLANLGAGGIRLKQELSVAAQAVGHSLTGGQFNAPALSLPAYTTTMFWITEYSETAPAQLAWSGPTPPTLDTTPGGTNVVLQWTPSTDPTFYSYQVARDSRSNVISPAPLRAALWVDTSVASSGPTTTHTYWVRAVSASQKFGAWSPSLVVPVP